MLDEDLTVAGRSRSSLFVSTTGTDSDFVVKLIDVYPNDAPDPNEKPEEAEARIRGQSPSTPGWAATSSSCAASPCAASSATSFEKPEPFEPGVPARVAFAMPDVFHTFRRGHRIMVQVQSTWFPLVDRNPQKFVDIYTATEADFQKATQRVYRAKDKASSVTVQVLP